MRAEGVNTDHKWLQLPDATVALYNDHDCVNTARLRHALRDEMERNGQWDFYGREILPLIPAAMSMQRRGLLVDREAWDNERRALLDERAEIEDWMCDYVGKPRRRHGEPFWMNSTSPRGGQRAEALFDTLDLKPSPVTKDRPWRSSNQEALTYIYNHLRKRDEEHKPFIENLFHWGKLKKLIELLQFRVDDDGRVRPTIKLYKQKTLRWSYTEPPLHQFASRGRWKRMRRILRAAPGCVLVGADFQRLELRVWAVLANDKPSLDAWASGIDEHRMNACDLFGYSDPARVTDLERDYAKSHGYKIIYGGDPSSEKAKQFCPCPRCESDAPPKLYLSPSDRKEAGERWFRRHPAARRYRALLKREVERTHWYTSPFGSRRCFMSPWSSELERELFNFPMQHGATVIKNRAMVRLQQVGAPLWLDHHDAIYLEVPEEEGLDWAARLREAMEIPVPELGDVTFPVDVSMGPNWKDMEPLS